MPVCAQKLALFLLTLFGTVLCPRASAQPAPAPPPAPRVAVCFVGGLRTFLLPGVYTSQSSNLLGALRAAGAETETYLYLELPAERSQAGIQPEARRILAALVRPLRQLRDACAVPARAATAARRLSPR